MNKVKSVLFMAGISLALAFTFSCSSGGDGGGDTQSSSSDTTISSSGGNVVGGSSSSGGEVASGSSSSFSAPPPEPVPVSNPSIEFSNFGVNEPDLDNIVTLVGAIRAKGSDAEGNLFLITKLEFRTNQNSETQPGWVSYEGTPVTKPIDVNTGSINLNNAKIDLKNAGIPCRADPYNITVIAYINEKKSNETGQFSKHCPASSSSAGGGPSSSSQGAWVFDGKQTLTNISENAEQTLGSVRFKFYSNEGDMVMTMLSGGEIKEFFKPGDDPVKDAKYYEPTWKIGSSLSNNIFIIGDDYIICSGSCSSSSSERYLIWFKKAAGTYGAEYWKVKSSP